MSDTGAFMNICIFIIILIQTGLRSESSIKFPQNYDVTFSGSLGVQSLLNEL